MMSISMTPMPDVLVQTVIIRFFPGFGFPRKSLRYPLLDTQTLTFKKAAAGRCFPGEDKRYCVRAGLMRPGSSMIATGEMRDGSGKPRGGVR